MVKMTSSICGEALVYSGNAMELEVTDARDRGGVLFHSEAVVQNDSQDF